MAKYILLDDKTWVNPEHVIRVEQSGFRRSKVFVVNGPDFEVSRPVDQVIALLEQRPMPGSEAVPENRGRRLEDHLSRFMSGDLASEL